MDKKFKAKKKHNIIEYSIKLSLWQQELSDFLSQYRNYIMRKRTLERRRREIMKEFDMPLSGVSMDGMPKGGGNFNGCAAISMRLDEIEQRIREQAEIATKVLNDIMDIIELLPENSPERGIIENRYVDRMGWDEICRENHFSKSHSIRYWKKGLDELLLMRRTKDIMKRNGFELSKENKTAEQIEKERRNLDKKEV